MGHIVGGIGSSHAPSIAHAWDTGAQQEALWKPLFDGYGPAKAWLADLKPDLMITIYNDHMNRFFFDAYPTFAIGVGEKHEIADEGWGVRDFSAFSGHTAFADHVTTSLVMDEFDMTICQEITIDHGILSIMPMLWDDPWPAPILPIAVNVIQHPVPTARRLLRLGHALRRAVESFPDDMRVVVLGTGGLSHQLHGDRFGMMNPEWDNRFLDLLEDDPDTLAGYDHAHFMREGGAESVEMIMWLAMRGALGEGAVKRIHRNYYAPMLTGYGLIVLESAAN